jgi:hypothetical protein
MVGSDINSPLIWFYLGMCNLILNQFQPARRESADARLLSAQEARPAVPQAA